MGIVKNYGVRITGGKSSKEPGKQQTPYFTITFSDKVLQKVNNTGYFAIYRFMDDCIELIPVSSDFPCARKLHAIKKCIQVSGKDCEKKLSRFVGEYDGKVETIEGKTFIPINAGMKKKRREKWDDLI